jgi:hypothetical protein
MTEESKSLHEAAIELDANGIRVSVKVKGPNAVEEAEKLVEKMLDLVTEVDDED